MRYIKLFENFDSPIKQPDPLTQPDPFTEEGIEKVRREGIQRRIEEERRREQIERIKREKGKEEKQREKVIEPSENVIQNYFY